MTNREMTETADMTMLSCPFCGSGELSHGFVDAGVYYGTAGCEADGCGIQAHADSEQAAIAAWNRRAILAPAGADDLVAELRKGEWWHSFIQGSNPTSFSQDKTHVAREAATAIAAYRQQIAGLEAEIERLRSHVVGGMLGDLLSKDESQALADFVKHLRQPAALDPVHE